MEKFYARPGGWHYHLKPCLMLAGGDFKKLHYKVVTVEECRKRRLEPCGCIDRNRGVKLMAKTAKDTKLETKPMWNYYYVELKLLNQLGASLPDTREEIRKLLEARQPAKAPPDATPLPTLTDQVAEEVGVTEEPEAQEVTRTQFKSDENGLYYEGRCVRGHLKGCALQISQLFPDIHGFKAKVASKVHVVEFKLPLGKREPDGKAEQRDPGENLELRYIQAMTRQGARSSRKLIDFVWQPTLKFHLKVLNDGVIQKHHLEAIFHFGSTQGIGQERSQMWGRYNLVALQEVTAMAAGEDVIPVSLPKPEKAK